MNRRSRVFRAATACAVTLGIGVAVGVSTPGAAAAPAPAAAPHDLSKPYVVSTSVVPGRERLKVWSPAMNRAVTVDIQHPVGTAPRPTLYLLDGSEAHDTESGWYANTDVKTLAAAENLNVVTPVGDPHSYYTDWKAFDPGIGKKYMYDTFLTSELPPIIDGQFHGNGRNAIAGASMGGVAALTLAVRHPALYRGVAGYSDCANTSSLPNQLLTQWDISRAGGSADNMWGPIGDPDWAAHDPYLLADKLRGKTIYMSSGNGVPAAYDNLFGDPVDQTAQAVLGEMGTYFCTGQMSSRLSSLGIPYTTAMRPTGTHKWGYWKDELRISWPILMGSLGLR